MTTAIRTLTLRDSGVVSTADRRKIRRRRPWLPSATSSLAKGATDARAPAAFPDSSLASASENLRIDLCRRGHTFVCRPRFKPNGFIPQIPVCRARGSFAMRFATLTQRGNGGFTLTEVAIAIGIAAFAFVTLLSLLSAGLGQFRSAIDAQTGARILQRIVSDAEQADFDQLLSTATRSTTDFYVLPIEYFDDEGNLIPTVGGTPPSGANAVKVVYQAHIRGSQPGPAAIDGVAHFTSLPAAAGNVRFSPRQSSILTIQIVHDPALSNLPETGALLWDDGAAANHGFRLKTFSAVITRNGFFTK